MTLTACQKDEGLVSDGATSQTITVTIPQGMQTRATAADFGNGAKIDRCLLQIYHSGTTPAKYGEQQSATVQKGADGKLTATFNLRLVAQQTYDFVFWADCSTGDHYNTDDLTNITVKGNYAGNNDEFDAFTGALLDYQVKGAFSENITLRRPFGQLNVKTLDMAAIPDPTLKPTKVKVAFTAVPTSFNAKKGEIGAATAAVEYTADVLSADGDLTVDYIWAPVEEATLADFSMTFLNGTTEISTNGDFKNIPIRRNYRTNVSGNLLTKQGTFNVTIDPEFYKPDINDYPELRAALANGGSVTLSDNMTVKEPLVVENGKTVEIDLNGHTITNETDVWAGNDWSLFSVRGGTLTIKNGTVKAKDNDCYACDVQYGGTLIIEDGTFVGNISAVYVHEGKAEIKGGTFSIVQTETEGDPYRFLLNCYDSNRQAGKASIVVTGGTFENFNPADNAAEGAGTNFVDEGYKAVKIAETPAPNGTFQVVKNAKVDNADELIGALADPEIANIEVASDIDLAAKSSEELTFEEHKTIDIKEGMTLQLGSANFLTAEKGLTLTGKGTLDNSAAASTAVVAAASDVHEHKSLIHVTGGDLLIDGVTLINDPEYHWHGSSYNTAAIAYWNDANVTIRNARVISGEFTLCGMGRNGANTATVTLIDSYFESTSSNLDNKTALGIRDASVRLRGIDRELRGQGYSGRCFNRRECQGRDSQRQVLYGQYLWTAGCLLRAICKQQRRSHDHGRRIFRSQRQDGIADRRYQCGRIRRQ